MAGEISPDIMFSKKTQKNVKNNPDGCAWVCMRANEWRGTGETKNSRKRNKNGRVMHFSGGGGTHKKTVKYDGALVTHQKIHATLWMGAHGPA